MFLNLISLKKEKKFTVLSTVFHNTQVNKPQNLEANNKNNITKTKIS